MKYNHRLFVILILRSAWIVVVGMIGLGLLIAIKEIFVNGLSGIVALPMIVLFGLCYFGIQSVIGMSLLVWIQDKSVFGSKLSLIILGSSFGGMLVGLVSSIIILPKISLGFDINLSIMGSVGGLIGGIYSGLLAYKHKVANQSVKVSA